MKLKTVVPWILVVLLALGVGISYQSGSAKEKDLAQLRLENAELPELRSEIDQAKKDSATNGTGVDPKEREELIRLRNEVGVLRREKQQMTAQLQQTQKSQEQSEALHARKAQLLQQLARVNQTQVPQQAEQSRDACINNLRQLDGAKQQWALENKQPANAFVVPEQIAVYLKGQAIPVCAAGGIYTLNAVNANATCSIPGHTLKQ
ncbi:MAG: hypothetical protein ABIQ35_15150 [Verrucomicrobiota bacterium]